MNNPNQQLYTIYKNVWRFYDYRRLSSIDVQLSQDAFIKDIQRDKYILLSAVDRSLVCDESGAVIADKVDETRRIVETHNEKSKDCAFAITHVLLVYPGTECESKRANMMKLINHVRYPKAHVLVITPTKITAGILKSLHALRSQREHSARDFKAFTYTLLNAVLPEHELVPRYEILSEAEMVQLRGWRIDPELLPKIFEHDPQIVWIGAEVGQVVRFTYPSEVTIESIGYCVVVPS